MNYPRADGENRAYKTHERANLFILSTLSVLKLQKVNVAQSSLDTCLKPSKHS